MIIIILSNGAPSDGTSAGYGKGAGSGSGIGHGDGDSDRFRQRLRRRLMRIDGWQDSRQRLLAARARHQRSAHHLKAMQAALHANMRGDC